MKKVLFIALSLLLSLSYVRTQAQAITLVADQGTNALYYASAAGGVIVFGVNNTNPYSVTLDSMSSYTENPSGNATYTLWYKASPLTGAPGIINAANGWTQLGGPTVIPSSKPAGVSMLFTNLNFTIAAGTAYRFAIVASGGESPYYVYQYAGPNLYATEGLEIWTQDNANSPSYAGTSPTAAPTLTPRGYLGSTHFTANGSCNVPPAPGGAVASETVICGNDETYLSLTGNSTGAGQTYVWESSATETGTYTAISSSSTASNYSLSPTATAWYRAAVTCGASTSYSNPVLVTVNSPLSGTYTIDNTQPTGGTNYTSFTDAINAVNCGTSGNVIFNVLANQTFNENPPELNGSGTASATITFQKSGVGANPVIFPVNPGQLVSSTTIGANGDAVITINGGDFITFNGIDINASGFTTGNDIYEYGYVIKRFSGADASKNITIKHSVITLGKGRRSAGIGIIGYAGATSSAPSNNGGRFENINISGNTILNTYDGIVVDGGSTSYLDSAIYIGVDSGNIITDFAGGASAAYGIYSIYAKDLKIAKNIVTTTGTGQTTTLYGIYTGAAINANILIDSNKITMTNGASSLYAIYNTSGGTGTNNLVKITRNRVDGNINNSTFYGIYQSATAYNIEINNNSLTNNISSPTGSSAHYLIYQTGAGVNSVKVYNNLIENNQRASGTTSAMYCLYVDAGAASTNSVYGNIIRNNSMNSSTTDITGIYSAALNNTSIYNNRISGLTVNSTGAGSVAGITLATAATTTNNVYNNFISNLNAPTSTNTTPVIVGINVTSTSANATHNLWNNTVYLNAYTGGTDFHTTAVYQTTSATATSGALRMYNNILINESTTSGAGYASAYRRSSATNGNFIASDNNQFYHQQGNNQVIYYNGTTSYTDLVSYKIGFPGYDMASKFGLPPFVNISSLPYDLHIQTTTPTQVESGGTPIAGVTTDIDGDARHATFPDIGADEFNGIAEDLTVPTIEYTALASGCFSGDVLLNGVNISDLSGVPTTGTLMPRVYYRKNGGSWFSNAGTLASGTGLNGVWNFTMLAADVNGLAVGDSLEYFVIAQDTKAGTPNVGANPVGVTATDVNNVSAPPSPLNVIYVGGALSGNYDVGSGGAFATLSQAVQVYNASTCISAPVTFTLTDASYSAESFPITIYDNPSATAVNNLTIKSATGVTPYFSGALSTAGSGLIRLLGADHVTLDGLTVEVTGTATTEYGWGIQLADDADSNTVVRCNVITTKDPAAAASTAFAGIVINASTATTPTATGNSECDYNTITENTVTGGYSGITVIANGTTASVTNNIISKNIVQDFYTYGIYTNGAQNTIIDSNDVSRPTRTSVSTFYGIYPTTGSQGTQVTRNRIHNTHDAASTTTGTIYGIYFNASDATIANPNIIANNFMYGFNNTGSGIQYGIYSTGSDSTKVYNNSVLLDGGSATGVTRCFYQGTAANGIDIKNNIFTISRQSTGANQLMYFSTTTSSFQSNYNDLFMNTTTGSANAVAYYSTNYNDLASWQGATAAGNQDQNSQSVDPMFISNTDLHLQPGSPLDDDGFPVGLSIDIDGDARSASTPDIGADELPPSVGLDIKAEKLESPDTTAGCYNTENLSAVIKNNSLSALDFSVNPVTVTIDVTGAATASYTAVVNTGTLASNDLLVVPMTTPSGTLDMSAAGVYNFTITAALTGDVNTANNMVAETREKLSLAAGTITVSPDSYCVTPGNPVLDTTGGLQGFSSFVWQQSATSLTGFTDIAGSNNVVPFTVPTSATQDMYYRLVATCGVNTSTSAEDTVMYNNPQILSTTGQTICSPGMVTLQATASAGTTINWYQNASGGTAIATGGTFTPTINDDSTFYVAASNGAGGMHSAGLINAVSTSGYTLEAGLIFDAFVPFNLEGVYVYPIGTGSGNVTIALQQISGSGQNTIYSIDVPLTGTGSPYVKTYVPLNFDIVPGTDYKLMMMSRSGLVASLVRESGSSWGSYPLTTSGVLSITNGNCCSGNATSVSYYYFYDWKISMGCESPRVAVTGVVDAGDPSCVPVPVTLVNFIGEKRGAVNRLSWTTATELNNAGFELQRSTDGVNFSKLSFVNTKAENGNSTEKLNYFYNDEQPLKGINYYRLKQLDKDGKYDYSGVVKLDGERVTEVQIVSVYPNPVRDRLNIKLQSPVSKKGTVIITDAMGKVLMQQAVELVNGDSRLDVNVSRLAQGNYFVKVICADGCTTAIHRFIKE